LPGPDGDALVTLLNWIDFQSLGDERGGLVALELGVGKPVPFDIKRVYYIHRTEPGVSRGFHAHRNLKQVAICVAGKCRIVLDDGNVREEAWLDSPLRGLLIGNLIWRELHDFSPDCVVLVLASEHYDEADYIRSYPDFLKLTGHG
jgi:dTDP-4-dehydrorhamnose 3,5-epimerase-like enzyme